jgi:23S rRNA (adenine2503-C2)-methyltransferase
MISVLDMTIEEIKDSITAMGQPAYRADQLVDWVFKKGVGDPAAMTNLPPAMRSQVAVLTSKVAARTDSEDGTIKLLLEYENRDSGLGTRDSERNGEDASSPKAESPIPKPASRIPNPESRIPKSASRIECVLIPTETRATVCLSTQVGCNMGCAFCASGADGMARNLTSGEILQQILHLQQAAGKKVTHAVFMGMGEPLANYENTLAAVRAIVDPRRLGVSARHVTISTVGIPKAIRRLAGEDLPVTLAISLHAPNDILRRQLIPLAERFTIEEILSAAQYLFEARGREVTLEYVLLGGVNDTPVCAEAMGKIAHRVRCNVNLIRYNPVPGLPYERPTQAAVHAFVLRLERAGVNVHVRKSRGIDAAAACGQLRRAATENDEEKPATEDTASDTV